MQLKYNEVTPEVLGELTVICGKTNVFTDEIDIEGYAHDETPLSENRYPAVVVKPHNTAEITGILSLANRRHIPVIARGAGTGLSGGAVSLCGGIVLSLERMDRIIEIDEHNFTAIAEAGVTLAVLRSEVEKRGLYYPIYPGELQATIGGNVSTNAGGMNAVKYGVTRQQILGLEAVLPDGTGIKTGGKFVKSSSGYDLTQLITGSEGTLAIISNIILKLAVKPPVREVLWAPFDDLQSAVNAVPEILKLKKYPIGLEFIERDIINIVEKHTGRQIPHHDHAAFLMVIMEGETQDEILDYFTGVEEICKKHQASEVLVPGSERAKRLLIESREKFYPALKKYAPMEIIDIVVPRSEIARFVARVKEIADTYAIPVIAYGHAGDGNVHLHPLCVNMPFSEWQEKMPALLKDLYRAGISFGGAVSGEHGIGFTKKPYLPLQISREQLALYKRIKKAFDPNNILNPGKIFD